MLGASAKRAHTTQGCAPNNLCVWSMCVCQRCTCSPASDGLVGTIVVEAHTSLKQRRGWQRASSAGSCHLLAQILVHRPKSRQPYHLAPQTAFCRRVSWELCRRLTWASARRQKRNVQCVIGYGKRGLERRACAVFEYFIFLD